jgi:hypothetical protein
LNPFFDSGDPMVWSNEVTNLIILSSFPFDPQLDIGDVDPDR